MSCQVFIDESLLKNLKNSTFRNFVKAEFVENINSFEHKGSVDKLTDLKNEFLVVKKKL